jgi:hypothetical protein
MSAQPHSGCGLQAQVAGVLSSGLGGLGGLGELGARVFCQIKDESESETTRARGAGSARARPPAQEVLDQPRHFV